MVSNKDSTALFLSALVAVAVLPDVLLAWEVGRGSATDVVVVLDAIIADEASDHELVAELSNLRNQLVIADRKQQDRDAVAEVILAVRSAIARYKSSDQSTS